LIGFVIFNENRCFNFVNRFGVFVKQKGYDKRNENRKGKEIPESEKLKKECFDIDGFFLTKLLLGIIKTCIHFLLLISLKEID